MFCKNCGTEISDSARFCPKCGNDRLGGQEVKNQIVEDGHIISTIRPEFNMLYQVLTTIWKGIIILFFIAYFISFSLLIYYPIIPIVFLIVYVIVKLIFGKIQYNNLSYNFYTTKVEYVDGFLNKEEKELKYKFVREVTMKQNVFERICGIGTIRIFTNASSGDYGYSRKHTEMAGKNGIYIHCVSNVKEEYQKIKQIIDAGTPED